MQRDKRDSAGERESSGCCRSIREPVFDATRQSAPAADGTEVPRWATRSNGGERGSVNSAGSRQSPKLMAQMARGRIYQKHSRQKMAGCAGINGVIALVPFDGIAGNLGRRLTNVCIDRARGDVQ